jgi:hypothetical protein
MRIKIIEVRPPAAPGKRIFADVRFSRMRKKGFPEPVSICSLSR